MGRKRKEENEKSVIYPISIKKKQLENLKAIGSPSLIIRELLTEYIEEHKKL